MEVVPNETVSTKMGSGDYYIGLPCAENNCAYGTHGVVVVLLFFQFLNWIIRSIGPPKCLRDDEWKWRNLTISYLHAGACVVWVFVCLAKHPDLLADLKHFKTDTVFYLAIFSTGYFLYDFLDLALNGKMFVMWEVQMHHISVGTMFYYNVAGCEWLAYNVIALLVEVNSFFLHQRKLMQMLAVPFDSRMYRITVFLNILTFIIFRGGPITGIWYSMVVLFPQVDTVYMVCLSFSMFVLTAMHPVLFMRLLRSDYLRKSDGKQESPGMKAVRNGNNNLTHKRNNIKQS